MNEPAKASGIAGMLCVVIGVLLIATQGRLAIFRQAQAWVGVRWGVVIGLFIAAYTVVDAYGVKVLLISPVLFDWFTCVTRTTMMTPHAASPGPELGIDARLLAPGAGRGLPVAAGLHPGVVRAAGRRAAEPGGAGPEMSMMLGTLAGMFLLREKVGIGRLLGCFSILAGVVLLGSA